MGKVWRTAQAEFDRCKITTLQRPHIYRLSVHPIAQTHVNLRIDAETDAVNRAIAHDRVKASRVRAAEVIGALIARLVTKWCKIEVRVTRDIAVVAYELALIVARIAAVFVVVNHQIFLAHEIGAREPIANVRAAHHAERMDNAVGLMADRDARLLL